MEEKNNKFVLNVSNTDEKIILSKDNYLKYLNNILERQVNDEQYEKCSITKDLINNISNSFEKTEVGG